MKAKKGDVKNNLEKLDVGRPSSVKIKILPVTVLLFYSKKECKWSTIK